MPNSKPQYVSVISSMSLVGDLPDAGGQTPLLTCTCRYSVLAVVCGQFTTIKGKAVTKMAVVQKDQQPFSSFVFLRSIF